MGRFDHLLSQTPRPLASASGKLAQALALRQVGIELFLGRLRRERPQLTADELHLELRAWLLSVEPLGAPLRRLSFDEYRAR